MHSATALHHGQEPEGPSSPCQMDQGTFSLPSDQRAITAHVFCLGSRVVAHEIIRIARMRGPLGAAPLLHFTMSPKTTTEPPLAEVVGHPPQEIGAASRIF